MLKKLGRDTNADAFLPMIIYVVIRANPPRLMSNVQYISRFRGQNRLRAETAYYYTNLMGAISFIESMDETSLTITSAEFDECVGLVFARPPRPLMRARATQLHEGVARPTGERGGADGAQRRR